MTHIVAIAGKKQAGKTTFCNFLHGYEMRRHDPTGEFTFFIGEDGELVVRTRTIDSQFKEHYSEGVLDVQSKTYDYIKFAQQRVWPFIKPYNFADTLKDICAEVLGLDYEQVFGTNEEKNSLTPYNWEDMPGVFDEDNLGYLNSGVAKQMGMNLHKSGKMTGREILQFVGTEIFRRMNQDVWVNCCLRQIDEEQPQIAIIGDCRFPNEADGIRRAGGKVIRLTRAPFADDTHPSETALDDYDNFDAVIENDGMTINEQNDAILKLLIEWGVTE